MRRIWTWYRGRGTKAQVVIGVIAGLFVLSGIGGAFGDDQKSTVKTEAAASSSPTTEAAAPTTTAQPAPTTTAAPTTTVAPTTTTAAPTTVPPTTVPPAPVASVSQKNARRSAESYLEFSNFSRSGLIHQLKFEGFSEPDATSAVDSLNVDWNEQAAKSAADYLEMSSFSHSGLVHQLEFEGFTPQQAEYGVGTTGL